MTTQSGNALSRPDRRQLSQSISQHVDSFQASKDDHADMRLFVDALLRDACAAEASDIHLDPHTEGLTVRFRVEGVLIDVVKLEMGAGSRLINGLKTLANLDPMHAFVPEESRQTYMLEERELDLRVAVTPCLAGQKLTVRVLDPNRTAMQLDDLGLSREHQQAMGKWLDQATGMFLCAGPTGSGKTTTLYALLHHFKAYERSAMTVEDPVEYQIDGITQIQVDEDRGLTFPLALKSMLRHDPDYLMVGEIRDGESAATAMDAAITGKVVMSTLHASDAVSTLTVLRSHSLGDQLIAAGLSFVVAQRLVPMLCEHCRNQGEPTEQELRWLAAVGVGREAPEHCWHAEGCEQCSGLGFTQRTGVFELWRLNEEDMNLILHHVNAAELRDHLRQRGHQTLIDDGLAKAEQGAVSIDGLRQTLGVPPGAG